MHTVEQDTRAVNRTRERESTGKYALAYVALAFGFSWLTWVPAIKLGLGEPILNIGTAGPAIAAIALSRRHKSGNAAFRAASSVVPFLLLIAGCWIVLALHYGRRGAPVLTRSTLLLIFPALLPAWIISRVFAADQGIRALLKRLVRWPDRWTAWALCFFVFLLVIPTLIAHAVGARLVWPEPHSSFMAAIAAATTFFLFNLLFVGVLEEPGWRGFLLDRLQLRFSPLFASFLVWFPWALWHAPLDYYRPAPFTWTTYVLLRVVFLIPLTITLTWFYNRSGRSIQSAVIFHAAMNTFPFVAPYYQPAWCLIFAFAIYAIVADRMWRATPFSLAANIRL